MCSTTPAAILPAKSPSERYALLKPWLEIAALGAQAKTKAEFEERLRKTEFTESPDVPQWQMMTWALGKNGYALARSVNTMLLVLTEPGLTEETIKVIWDNAGEGLRLTKVRFAGGCLHLEVLDPRDRFHAALEGVQGRRLKRCEVCETIFYARRAKGRSKNYDASSKACSKRCNETQRKRHSREKHEQYEYNRYLKLEGRNAEKGRR